VPAALAWARAKPSVPAVLALIGDPGRGSEALGLRAIIEPEDSLNRTGELGGQKDAAFTDAIGISVESLLREGDAKGFLHSSDGPGELDGAPLRLRCVFSDGEPELFRESAHQLDGGRIGGVLLAILCACEAIFAQALGIERVLAPDDDRNGDRRCRGAPAFRRLLRTGGAFSLPAERRVAGKRSGGRIFCSHGEFSEVRTHFLTTHMPVYVSKEVTSGIPIVVSRYACHLYGNA
jgi:hypothetical protein